MDEEGNERVVELEKCPNENRFVELRAWCPRCGVTTRTDQFIVNVTGKRGICATFVCPACADLVQILMRGESMATGDPRT